ncbi:hypothetical protein CONLIGDRAFT_692411 [Coniochaeta ligniaria NRRL 30616]|uniref:Uncharacterized protein n=1 Tax=Coniochaeta ligniaria NRRL 30616 TaxID=1408157 RepID=A0A1J7I9S0_9PEZI|nr:hypothetical protein CONLIGDRAFT_692411 [Coniochaeta ligniaria NRRL 30616]
MCKTNDDKVRPSLSLPIHPIPPHPTTPLTPLLPQQICSHPIPPPGQPVPTIHLCGDTLSRLLWHLYELSITPATPDVVSFISANFELDDLLLDLNLDAAAGVDRGLVEGVLRFNIGWLMGWAVRQGLVVVKSSGDDDGTETGTETWEWRRFGGFVEFARVVGEECGLDDDAEAWEREGGGGVGGDTSVATARSSREETSAATARNSEESFDSAATARSSRESFDSAATARMVSVRELEEDELYQYPRLPGTPVPEDMDKRLPVRGSAFHQEYNRPAQHHRRDRDGYSGVDRPESVDTDDARGFYSRHALDNDDGVGDVFGVDNYWASAASLPSHAALPQQNNITPQSSNQIFSNSHVPDLINSREVVRDMQSNQGYYHNPPVPKAEDTPTPRAAGLDPRAAPYTQPEPIAPVPQVRLPQHIVQAKQKQPYRHQQDQQQSRPAKRTPPNPNPAPAPVPAARRQQQQRHVIQQQQQQAPHNRRSTPPAPANQIPTTTTTRPAAPPPPQQQQQRETSTNPFWGARPRRPRALRP